MESLRKRQYLVGKVKRTLDETNGNVQETAKRLKLPESTIRSVQDTIKKGEENREKINNQ